MTCVFIRVRFIHLLFSHVPAPTAALLLLLADLGPRDRRKSSIKRCRKRMERLRSNLAPRSERVIILSDLEATRTEALRTLEGRCAMCGLCVFRSDSAN